MGRARARAPDEGPGAGELGRERPRRDRFAEAADAADPRQLETAPVPGETAEGVEVEPALAGDDGVGLDAPRRLVAALRAEVVDLDRLTGRGSFTQLSEVLGNVELDAHPFEPERVPELVERRRERTLGLGAPRPRASPGPRPRARNPRPA